MGERRFGAFSIEALASEFLFKPTKSRGPGGQHVNKTSTGVYLYWAFECSSQLTDEEQHLIRTKLSPIINRDGEIYIKSDVSRSLKANKEQCVVKLGLHLEHAFKKRKKRKKTKPTRASKEKRLQTKRKRSETKKYRRSVGADNQ